jgi:multidrug efflux pump subunit AcrA (membrane-fusion protein)
MPVGTPVQIDISAEEHRDVVVVPVTAVVHEGDEIAVFVVTERKAHRHPVQTGVADGAKVEITSGINAGDRVIVDGQSGLPDGAPITEARSPGSETPAAVKDGGQ